MFARACTKASGLTAMSPRKACAVAQPARRQEPPFLGDDDLDVVADRLLHTGAERLGSG